MLLENGYPLDFIFNVINRRLKRNYSYIRLMYGIKENPINKKDFMVIPCVKSILEMATSFINKSTINRFPHTEQIE